MKLSWRTRNLTRHNWTLLTWLVTKQIQKCLRIQFSITLSWVQVFIFFKENQAFFMQLTSIISACIIVKARWRIPFVLTKNILHAAKFRFIFFSKAYCIFWIRLAIDRFCNWNWLLFLVLSTKKTWTSPISSSDFNTFLKDYIKNTSVSVTPVKALLYHSWKRFKTIGKNNNLGLA